MAPIRAIFFDAGNTLVMIDFELVARTLANGVTGERLAAVSPGVFSAYHRYLACTAASTEAPESFGFIFGELARQAGFAITREGVERLRAVYREKTIWRVVNPDALAVLPALQSAGFKLGVISNADGRVGELIEELGLSHFFPTIIDSGRVGVVKPDPRIFHLALERIGAAAEEAVYVGDLPIVDAEGATAAGLAAVIYDPAGIFAREEEGLRHAGRRVARVRSHAELPAVLAGL